MPTPNLSEVHASYTAAEIARLQREVASMRSWEPTRRRDALIEEREMRIDELTSALEFGAEIANAEITPILIASDPDAQIAEMERAADMLGARDGWHGSVVPKVAMASAWGPAGAYIGIVALDNDGFLLCVESPATALLEVRCEAGELFATIIAHARSVEAAPITTASAPAEVFAY